MRPISFRAVQIFNDENKVWPSVGDHALKYWVTVDVFAFVDTRYIKMFVLDEADEMLSRGFKDQIYDVFKHLNENIQVRLFPDLDCFQTFKINFYHQYTHVL